MAGPVTYSYATWIERFPEFSGVSSGQGQGFFDRATNFWANTTVNPSFSAGNLESLLYLATSHIAWLNAPRDALGNPSSTGQPPPPLVGRISSAAEGSVNVSTEWKGSGSPSEEWWVQTRYGAEFWQATAQFRTARYMANPTFVPGTRYPFYYPRFR